MALFFGETICGSGPYLNEQKMHAGTCMVFTRQECQQYQLTYKLTPSSVESRTSMVQEMCFDGYKHLACIFVFSLVLENIMQHIDLLANYSTSFKEYLV